MRKYREIPVTLLQGIKNAKEEAAADYNCK